MVINRLQGKAPGMTKEEAAKVLGVGRRSVDTKLINLTAKLLEEKDITI